MRSMTANELEELLETGTTIRILDVREDEEVAYGIIPGAHHIPLGYIPARTEELDKSATYAVICKAGGRSYQACLFLEEQGYDVINVEGGMLDWNGETIA